MAISGSAVCILRCISNKCACDVCVSGEDLVSEQTCQREEDQQEEAAAFPAGLHNYAYPTRAGRTE